MTVPANESRKTPAIRQSSQAAFGALMGVLQENGFEAVGQSLQGLGHVEDVMRKSPAVVGLLMSLAWRYRSSPSLESFFKGQGETVVANEADPIAPCGRSFNDIRKAHLLGTARLYLSQGNRAKLAGQPSSAKTKSALGRLLAFLIRKKSPTNPLPANDIFAAVKPHLLHHGQFDIIPGYAHLTVRQAHILGSLLPAITSASALKAVSATEAGHLKALVRVALVFAATVLSRASLTEKYVTAATPLTGGAIVAIDDLVAGMALNKLFSDYADIAVLAANNEENAMALVKRLASTSGIDLWVAFRDLTSASNIQFCPEAVADALGLSAGLIHDAVSTTFSDAKNLDALGLIVADIAKDLGPEDFKTIAGTTAHVKAWAGVIANVNRSEHLDSGADLTLPKTIAVMQTIVAAALRSFQPLLAQSPSARAA